MAAKRPPEDPPTVDDPATEDPGPAGNQTPPAAPIPPGPTEHRFFTWMRSLGIVRQPGWIGGVSTGIADRLGIDPLIVRGILVVVAVLGGPALLLYAAAWLLLPDHNNKIHLEQLIRGNLEAPIAGIGVMVLLSMLPVTQGFWFAGSAFWGAPYWDVSIGRVFWTIVVLAAIVAFVVWVARRSARSEPTVTPATTDDRPDTIPQPRREDAAAASRADAVASPGSTASATAASATGGASTSVPFAGQAGTAPPPAPAAAPVDASAEELAAWREQQALWKQQNAEWKAQQSATERELRQQRAAEARDRALASAADAAERRRLHMLANPRISGAAAWGTIGAAIVAGGISSLVAAGTSEFAGYAVTVGLAVAAIVFGLSIVAAGALRKRSGILSFLATLVLLATVVTAAFPHDRVLLGTDSGLGTGESSQYSQLVGRLWIGVHEESPTGITDIWQGAGNIHIQVMEGATARVEIVSRTGAVSLVDETSGSGVEGNWMSNDEWFGVITVGDGGDPATIRIWQGQGSITIRNENQPAEEEVTP